ncbi:MAG TPA: branched-chain amino acid ABC transporter permease [Gaiellaceae bacterium]|nr:branched-chain amino acid ABC transporter permease [Gaiellaceae bacterium]
MDWSLFLNLTVSGLTLGAMYALIALGYSMVYGILKLLNFAHGDVFMVGAYIGWFVLHGLGGPLGTDIAPDLVLLLMFVGAMLGCGVLGVGIERFAYRPLRKAPRIAPLISALGVSIFLQNSALLIFGAAFRDYDTYHFVGVKTFQVGNLFISGPELLTIGAAIGLMIALTLFVDRSRTGKAMRSTSYDREAASMMGIDVDRVIAITFFIGSALAGAAGVMWGLVFGQIYNYMGFIVGLKAFTAAVVGGIGSIPGAMVGGFIVGLAEAYSTGYLPQGSIFANLYVFALLILVILIKPSGLFGQAAITKA